MTKKEIVRTISEEIGLTQLQTKEIVQKTFDAIVEALVEERRIELRNFGVFEVKRRAPARPEPADRRQGVRAGEVRGHVQARQGNGRTRSRVGNQAAAAAKTGRTKTAPPMARHVRAGSPWGLDGLRPAARGVLILAAAAFGPPSASFLVPLFSSRHFSLRSVSRRRLVCARTFRCRVRPAGQHDRRVHYPGLLGRSGPPHAGIDVHVGKPASVSWTNGSGCGCLISPTT